MAACQGQGSGNVDPGGRVTVKLGQLLSTHPTDIITDFSWLCVFQEVHELFQDYELKYCYVDRNKRTGERSVPST